MEHAYSLTCTINQCETHSLLSREQNQGKNTIPVDHPTIRILRPVPLYRRQSIDEGLLKECPGPVTGNLDRSCSEPEDLNCFPVSDVVKEPSAARLHCQTLPGHFKQCKRIFLFVRFHSPCRMIMEEFLDGF